jgi:hypothetical protein
MCVGATALSATVHQTCLSRTAARSTSAEPGFPSCWLSRTSSQLIPDGVRPARLLAGLIVIPHLELFPHHQRGFTVPMPTAEPSAVIVTAVIVWLSQMVFPDSVVLPHLHGATTSGAWWSVFGHDHVFFAHTIPPPFFTALPTCLTVLVCAPIQLDRRIRT